MQGGGGLGRAAVRPLPPGSAHFSLLASSRSRACTIWEPGTGYYTIVERKRYGLSSLYPVPLKFLSSTLFFVCYFWLLFSDWCAEVLVSVAWLKRCVRCMFFHQRIKMIKVKGYKMSHFWVCFSLFISDARCILFATTKLGVSDIQIKLMLKCTWTTLQEDSLWMK